MTDIATIEPLEVRAGDTWEWRREDLATDYPASTWTLTYTFANADAKFQISASADGDDFAVTLAAASSNKPAGVYGWVAKVSYSGEVHTVGSGTLTVLPDLATLTVHDGRSHARKVLDAIEALLEDRASIDQKSISIAGRTLERTPITDLLALRSVYRIEARNEEAQEKLARGEGSPRVIGVRF